MAVPQFIGATKRYKAVETLGGDPSPSPLACAWSTNAPERLTLAPVAPDAHGNSLECDVTINADVSPDTVTLYASVPNSGPLGSIAIDMRFPVDALTVIQE